MTETKDRAPLDYERAYREQLSRNVIALRAAIAPEGCIDASLATRLSAFAARHGHTVSDVLAALREPGPAASMLAQSLATDPVKQGLHERLAGEHIAAMTGLVSDFEVLPKRGRASLYLGEDGQVSAQPAKSRTGIGVKSIDFTWRTGKVTVFALHKYTRESGGGQAHQLDEARRFLRSAQAAQRLPGPPRLFLAILDGPFYEHRDRHGVSVREQVRSDLGPVAGVHAVGVNELHSLLRQVRRS